MNRVFRRLLWAGLLFAPALASAQRPKGDPILSGFPEKIRKVCKETFPDARVLKVTERETRDGPLYRFTLFYPDDTTVHHRSVGGETVRQLLTYDLELTADGKVLEESRHSVRESQVPKVVLASYHQWN